MKKFIYILILPFFLSGCFYQSVNKNDILVATFICMKNGAEVVEIKSHFIGTESVFCSDRKVYIIDNRSIGNP